MKRILAAIVLTAILFQGAMAAPPGKGERPAKGSPAARVTGENIYAPFVSGARSLGFKPAGRFNKEIYWYIKNKYPHIVEDEILFRGSKEHLKMLLRACSLDPAGVDSLPDTGDVLVAFLDKYKGRVSQELAVYACARGMLESLKDPECEIILPSQSKDPAKDLVPEGYGGLGILIEERNGRIVIIHPFSGCPGAKAGLKAGDVVLSIGGKPVKGLDLDTVQDSLRGPVGSSVALELSRRGKVFRKGIARETVNVKPVYAGVLPNGAGYVKVVYFGETYPQDVYSAVEIFKKKKISRWVLDLRDNSGGFVNNLIVMGSLFIPGEEPLMYIKYREKEKEKEFKSAARRNIPAPSVVLVNAYTTGTAEMLAEVLKENCGSRIMGSVTRGNTAVAELFKLTGGGTLKLTIGVMLSGRKSDIHRRGIAPDLPLKGVDDPANEESIIRQLVAAMKTLR